MSEHLHPGLHPDADSLTAFIEGVLPEHDRLECLAHLADCERCREIVYLAQEPVAPVSLPADPVPFWKRWFGPIPVLAAAVCVLLVSIGVYRLIEAKRVEPALTAVATPPFEPPAPLAEPPKQEPAPLPAKTIARGAPAQPVEHPGIIQDAAPVATAPRAVPVSPAPPPPAPVVERFAAVSNADARIASSGIAGTVTDAAGVVVPGARVTVRPVAGASAIDTRTDGKGNYALAGLAPGQYELQFLSPGFKQEKKQIDLQPQLVARADSILEVGAATDTVTVMNGAPLLKTESGVIAGAAGAASPRAPSALPLLPPNSRAGLLSESPGRLPPSTTASKDKLMLRTDSAGAVFFSKNGGKSWKAVKPVWRGKVVRVESAHDAGAVFQLTTDSGSVWLSRDCAHWNPAPAPR